MPGGTTGVLGVMVMPYHSEQRWSRVGAVSVSDICQFRDNSQVSRFLLETASVERVNITINFSLNLILYGNPEHRLVPAMVIGGH